MQRTSGELPQSAHNADRIRRARSWLERSEKSASGLEKAESEEEKAGLHCEQFIFLWIAFNAAYGFELIGPRDIDDRKYGEWEKFGNFLKRILDLDKEGSIQKILWGKTYSDSIRILLENQYVFRPFWNWVRGSGDENWHDRFRNRKRRVHRALGEDNVHRVLEEVFDRLYVLRNQIFHGGATFATGWGREQVRDGSRIMASLVPVIVDIMEADIENNPDSGTWGKVAYPRTTKAPSKDLHVTTLRSTPRARS